MPTCTWCVTTARIGGMSPSGATACCGIPATNSGEGRCQTVISSMSDSAAGRHRLFESWPISTNAATSHRGSRIQGARNADLTRLLPDTNFDHFSVDASGMYLVARQGAWRNCDHIELYLAAFSAGASPTLSVRYLLNPRTVKQSRNKPRPFFSPDARTVFFHSDLDGSSQIFLATGYELPPPAEGFPSATNTDDESTSPKTDGVKSSLLCPPTDVVARRYAYRLCICLMWSDNNSDEEGYVVVRSEPGASSKLLCTLGANVTEYTDTTAPKGECVYRVHAFKGRDKGPYATMSVGPATSRFVSATFAGEPRTADGMVRH